MAKKIPSIKEVIDSSVVQVAPDITVEKLSALYLHEALVGLPEPLYRLDSYGHRYYYRWQNEEPVFYTSVTTLIRNTLPTSPHLIKWMVAQGDKGKEIAEERADYGTFLHIQCADLLMFGKYDLDKLSLKIEQFCKSNKTDVREEWGQDLKKDILSFAQFIIDRQVKPIAIEICLYHPDDGYAGAIDLVAEMDFNRKRITAIIDLKSGKKGFYESHEIQLGAYREMWQIHFPDKPIDKTFNWSPKDWRTTPSYNLKDQTDSKNISKLPHLVELARLEDAKRDNSITVISGKIDLLKGLNTNVEELTFTELIKKNK